MLFPWIMGALLVQITLLLGILGFIYTSGTKKKGMVRFGWFNITSSSVIMFFIGVS